MVENIWWVPHSSRQGAPQSRYNKECLSPISDMDFQFLAIWAAQGSTEKKWADYEQLLRVVFSWAFIFDIVVFALKSCIISLLYKKKKKWGQNRLPLRIWILSVRVKRPWGRFCSIFFVEGSILKVIAVKIEI